MPEIITLFIGIIILILGFPIGLILAQLTKEELFQGKLWFGLIIIVGFIGAVVSLILKNDVLLFSFLFISIVTSMSLKRKKKRR